MYIKYFCLTLLAMWLMVTQQAHGQEPPKITALTDTVPRGVSVSPSSMRFSLKPGTSQSKKLNVFNDTDFERTFEVKTNDYGLNDINRAAADAKTDADFKFGLSKWTYITPSVFTLKPGEKMSVNVLIDIPAGDENNHAAWNMIIVEEVKERAPLDVGNNQTAVALGIIPTMGFGIFAYQNPPDLKVTEIALQSYRITTDKKSLTISAKNTGLGIGFCTYYFEVMNMATGQVTKIPPMQSTLLPGAQRDFKADLPPLPSGSYNAMVVLDYGSKEMVETGEIDFSIP